MMVSVEWAQTRCFCGWTPSTDEANADGVVAHMRSHDGQALPHDPKHGTLMVADPPRADVRERIINAAYDSPNSGLTQRGLLNAAAEALRCAVERIEDVGDVGDDGQNRGLGIAQQIVETLLQQIEHGQEG